MSYQIELFQKKSNLKRWNVDSKDSIFPESTKTINQHQCKDQLRHICLVWSFHFGIVMYSETNSFSLSVIINFHCRSRLLKYRRTVTETLVYQKTTSRRFYRLLCGTLNYIIIYSVLCSQRMTFMK